MREIVTGLSALRQCFTSETQRNRPARPLSETDPRQEGEAPDRSAVGCGDRLIQNEGLRLPPAAAAHHTKPGPPTRSPGPNARACPARAYMLRCRAPCLQGARHHDDQMSRKRPASFVTCGDERDEVADLGEWSFSCFTLLSVDAAESPRKVPGDSQRQRVIFPPCMSCADACTPVLRRLRGMEARRRGFRGCSQVLPHSSSLRSELTLVAGRSSWGEHDSQGDCVVDV